MFADLQFTWVTSLSKTGASIPLVLLDGGAAGAALTLRRLYLWQVEK